MFGNVYISFYAFIKLFKTLFSPPTLLSLYIPSCLYKTSVFSSIIFYFWYLLYSAVYCDSFSLGELGRCCFNAVGFFPPPVWCIFWGVLVCGLPNNFEKSIWPSAKNRFFTPVLQEWKNPKFLLSCSLFVWRFGSWISCIWDCISKLVKFRNRNKKLGIHPSWEPPPQLSCVRPTHVLL